MTTAPGHPPARFSEAQRRQVLIDVERRSILGVYAQLPVWVLVCAFSGIGKQHGLLVGLIALSMAVLLGARLVLHRLFAPLVARRHVLAHCLFLGMVLIGTFQWGVLVWASRWWSPLMPAHEVLRLVGVAIGAAGTMTMAILPSARIGLATSITVPYGAALLVPGDRESVLLALLVVVFLCHILLVSREVSRDYWAAMDARLLLEQRAEELERLSVTDALTQVHNRLYFDRRIGEEWTRAQRSAQHLSVLMVDLDHFKKINDQHGHSFGDTCLKESASALRRVIQRPGDVIARYGGEEFVVLLPDTDASAATRVAERMRQAVADLRLCSARGPARVTCSVGLSSMSPTRYSNWMALLAQADAALYLAKARGRDRVVAHPTETVA